MEVTLSLSKFGTRPDGSAPGHNFVSVGLSDNNGYDSANLLADSANVVLP